MYQNKQTNLDKLRSRISIVDVIGNFIKLSKKGNNSVGLCPFHDDKHASLSVNESKKIYKCFSCGNSGDVFTFVKNFNHCTYQEAIAQTCEIANLNLDEFSDIKTFIANKNKNLNLIEINKKANEYFKMFLDNKENQEARDYLAKRDISKELIKKFDIGFAPNSNIVIDLINNKDDIVKGAKGFAYDEIAKAGLAIISDQGDYETYFKNRITFAIRNEYDEVVGFSARTLTQSASKYINTPTTDIFLKNEVLYNFNNVIKQYDTESIYVLEGFMDVIALHKIGITNAVATMGVAFSKNHINTLKKLPNLKSIILCFDNDEAGQGSIEKTAEIIKPYYDVYIVQYDSEFKDIDEIYMNNKDEAIRNAKRIISYHLFEINKIISKCDQTNPVDKKNAIAKIVSILQTYKDSVELLTDITTIAQQLNISEDILKNAVQLEGKSSSKKQYSPNYKKYEVNQVDLSHKPKQKVPHKTPLEVHEDQIILMCLASAKNLDTFYEKCGNASLDKTVKYLELMDKFYSTHKDETSINLVNVYNLTQDDAIVGNLVHEYLIQLESMKAKFDDKKVNATIESYKNYLDNSKITKQLEIIMQEEDVELRQEMMIDYINKIRNKKKS